MHCSAIFLDFPILSVAEVSILEGQDLSLGTHYLRKDLWKKWIASEMMEIK